MKCFFHNSINELAFTQKYFPNIVTKQTNVGCHVIFSTWLFYHYLPVTHNSMLASREPDCIKPKILLICSFFVWGKSISVSKPYLITGFLSTHLQCWVNKCLGLVSTCSMFSWQMFGVSSTAVQFLVESLNNYFCLVNKCSLFIQRALSAWPTSVYKWLVIGQRLSIELTDFLFSQHMFSSQSTSLSVMSNECLVVSEAVFSDTS